MLTISPIGVSQAELFQYTFWSAIVISIATVGSFIWRTHQRQTREFEIERLHREEEREQRKLQIEEERERRRHALEERKLEIEENARYDARRQEEERLTREKAGTGSGGYIVMDMGDKERPFFHDLLKGFEDYAKLKGYEIAFSIDASFENRIAFKFTVKADGVVVSSERVRHDFKEFVDQVRNGKIEDFDDIPVATNLEEHNLLVAQLKNRVTFLQESLKFSKNSNQVYEQLLIGARAFPALPAAPTVVVQTGGHMDGRNYTATNSQRLIQGDSNSYTDSSVNIDIGGSFTERQIRIAALDELIAKLKAAGIKDEPVQKAEIQLTKVRDELADDPQPDKSFIMKWLGSAKNAMATAALGFEVTEAAKKLFELFAM